MDASSLITFTLTSAAKNPDSYPLLAQAQYLTWQTLKINIFTPHFEHVPE
jgi:hypothetical protein